MKTFRNIHWVLWGPVHLPPFTIKTLRDIHKCSLWSYPSQLHIDNLLPIGMPMSVERYVHQIHQMPVRLEGSAFRQCQLSVSEYFLTVVFLQHRICLLPPPSSPPPPLDLTATDKIYWYLVKDTTTTRVSTFIILVSYTGRGDLFPFDYKYKFIKQHPYTIL